MKIAEKILHLLFSFPFCFSNLGHVQLLSSLTAPGRKRSLNSLSNLNTKFLIRDIVIHVGQEANSQRTQNTIQKNFPSNISEVNWRIKWLLKRSRGLSLSGHSATDPGAVPLPSFYLLVATEASLSWKLKTFLYFCPRGSLPTFPSLLVAVPLCHASNVLWELFVSLFCLRSICRGREIIHTFLSKKFMTSFPTPEHI